MTMKLLSVFATVLVFAGCASHPVAPTKGKTTADFVQRDGDIFGWSGIRLGDTIPAVEHETGQTVSPYPDGYPACGSLSSDLTLQGRKVVLQLDEDRGKIVRSINVDMPDNEQDVSMVKMAEILEKRFPDLRVIFSDEDSIELVSDDGQAIFIKNHKEHFLVVTSAGCIESE
jgi:hypothetical protein